MTTRTMNTTLPGAGPLWLIVACVPAIVSFFPAPSAGQSSNPPMIAGELEAMNTPEVNGDWSYASGEAGRERVKQAIREAIQNMDPLSQEIAEEKLQEQLAPVAKIGVEIRGQEITMSLGEMHIDAALGTWVPWSHDGTDYDVHFRLTDDGALIQRVRSDKSEVRRRFKRKDDRLLVSFRLQDERLPDDIDYWLAYQ